MRVLILYKLLEGSLAEMGVSVSEMDPNVSEMSPGVSALTLPGLVTDTASMTS